MSVANADMLSVLQDALHSIVVGGAESYTVQLPGGGSRTFTSLDIAKLKELIDHYSALVNRSSRRMFAGVAFREAN